MLFYSKASQYALRALSYLIKHSYSKPCQASVIAESEDIPKHFLSKILQKMVESGLLKSLKGPGGGFVFAKDPKDIMLYEVINVFDDFESDMQHCAIGWNQCSDQKPCDLHETYKKLREHVKQYFQSINLELFTEVSLKKGGPGDDTQYEI